MFFVFFTCVSTPKNDREAFPKAFRKAAAAKPQPQLAAQRAVAPSRGFAIGFAKGFAAGFPEILKRDHDEIEDAKT